MNQDDIRSLRIAVEFGRELTRDEVVEILTALEASQQEVDALKRRDR